LLIGETGSGKSTTIHFLAGSEMSRAVVNNLPHIAFNTNNPELQKILTSPD
jgi:ABC-type glutathione transport system ATPase component